MANDKDFRVKNGLYVATDANILGNTVIAQKLTANGNINFTSSPNVALGPVGNVVITGGSNGQYLQTNGSGGLAWAAVSGAASISNGNSNVNIPTANGNVVVSVAGVANITTFTNNAIFRGAYGLTGIISQSNTAPASPQNGDQWYNTFNGILFEYLDDGTSSQWVDISSLPLPNLSTSNASAVLNNVQSTGTYFPAFISSTANGNYALSSNTAFSANLANGAMIATTFVGALSGAATSATTAGTVTTAAQPNITSVGTLSSLTVSGNTSAGNLNTAGAVVASTLTSNVATGTAPLTVTSTTRVANLNVNYANVADFISVAAGTGNNFLIFANAATGNITELTSTGLTANLSNNSITATTFVGALSGAATSATTAGTVTTAAQPNITSVGTLNSANIINNSTGYSVQLPGIVGSATTDSRITTLSSRGTLSVPTQIQSGDILLTITPQPYTGSAFTGAGRIQFVATEAIGALARGSRVELLGIPTGSATQSTASWDGQTFQVDGAVGANSTITGTRLISNVATGTAPLTVTSTTRVSNLNVANAGFADTAGSATTAGSVTTAAQGNITSVGTLTSLSVTGNVAAGNLTTTGVLSVTGTGVSSIAGNLDMTSNTITNLATPTASTDAATKQYVDDVAQGLNIHASCNAATTTTLASISGGTVTYNNGTAGVGATLTTTGSYTTIDGVTLSNGMRILVKNEVTTANNGIYVRTSATVLTRATDFDSAVEIAGGDFTFITAGTQYNSTGWVQIDEVTTVGTDPIVWEQFSGAGTYQAGTGLTLTGSTFSVNASQSQITSVGTLTGLNSSGTITAPAFTANTGVFTGNGNGLSSIVGANVTGAVSFATTANAVAGANVSGTVANATFATSAGSATTAGTVTTAAQPNITSTGTLTGLTVSGTTSLSTASGFVSVGGTSQFNSFKYNQDGGALGTTVGNQVRHATYYSSSSNADYLEITNTRYANGADWTTAGSRLQQKIDATWMGFIQFNGAVQGGITFGTGTSTAGPNGISGRTVMDTSGNFYPLADNSLTLGASGQRWSTAFATTVQTTALTAGSNVTAGTVTGNWTLTAGSRWQATYADLAENYAADATYEPGTVLLFGGEQEVTLANAFDSTRVAGVVTTNPAYSMNAALEAEYVAEIALQGRVPCKVIGPIEKGDLMVSASNGHATANNDARAGTIIGKALENFNGDFGVIEVAVGRF